MFGEEHKLCNSFYSSPLTHVENVCIPQIIFYTLYGCNNVYAARSEMIIGDTTHTHKYTMIEHYIKQASC